MEWYLTFKLNTKKGDALHVTLGKMMFDLQLTLRLKEWWLLCDLKRLWDQWPKCWVKGWWPLNDLPLKEGWKGQWWRWRMLRLDYVVVSRRAELLFIKWEESTGRGQNCVGWQDGYRTLVFLSNVWMLNFERLESGKEVTYRRKCGIIPHRMVILCSRSRSVSGWGGVGWVGWGGAWWFITLYININD